MTAKGIAEYALEVSGGGPVGGWPEGGRVADGWGVGPLVVCG